MTASTAKATDRRRPDTDFSGVQMALRDLGYRLTLDEVARVVELVLMERAERRTWVASHLDRAGL